MSYYKMPKACQDYGLGYQTVDQARDNLEEMLTDWSAEHGSSRPFTLGATPASPYNAFGYHDIPNIPRAVIDVSVSTGLGGVVSVGIQQLAQVVVSVQRVLPGAWFIALAPQLELFFGDPQPAQTSATPARFCVPRCSPTAGANGTPNGLAVLTYEFSAGDFVATDYSFTCGIYSYS